MERLEADGIETINDLLEEANKKDENITIGTASNNDPLTRIGVEYNEEDLNNLIYRAKWISKEYNAKFKTMFESKDFRSEEVSLIF